MLIYFSFHSIKHVHLLKCCSVKSQDETAKALPHLCNWWRFFLWFIVVVFVVIVVIRHLNYTIIVVLYRGNEFLSDFLVSSCIVWASSSMLTQFINSSSLSPTGGGGKGMITFVDSSVVKPPFFQQFWIVTSVTLAQAPLIVCMASNRLMRFATVWARSSVSVVSSKMSTSFWHTHACNSLSLTWWYPCRRVAKLMLYSVEENAARCFAMT